MRTLATRGRLSYSPSDNFDLLLGRRSVLPSSVCKSLARAVPPQETVLHLDEAAVARERQAYAARDEGERTPRVLERIAPGLRLSRCSGRSAWCQDEEALGIDPLQAEIVRLMFRLALLGYDGSGPMGVKAIATI